MKPPAARADFDLLARPYRLMERLVFGGDLERMRFTLIPLLPATGRCLLLGDGDGRMLERLVQQRPAMSFDVVESSPAMIRRARKRLSASDAARVTHHEADARAFAYPDNCYTVVVTAFFLDCFEPQEARLLIRRLRPALGARAVWLWADFRLPPKGWKRLRARLWLRFLYAGSRLLTGLKLNEWPDGEALLKAEGFQAITWRTRQHDMLRCVLFES